MEYIIYDLNLTSEADFWTIRTFLPDFLSMWPHLVIPTSGNTERVNDSHYLKWKFSRRWAQANVSFRNLDWWGNTGLVTHARTSSNYVYRTKMCTVFISSRIKEHVSSVKESCFHFEHILQAIKALTSETKCQYMCLPVRRARGLLGPSNPLVVMAMARTIDFRGK